MNRHEVLFQPDGLRVTVDEGTLLSEAMIEAGINIHLPCGGTGKCGKCSVEIHPDAPPATDFDRLHITEHDLGQGMRLACRTKVDRDMSVLMHPGIRMLGGKILVDGLDRTFDIEPVVLKTHITVPEPTLEDQAADLFRIKRAIGLTDNSCPDFDIDLLRELPHALRSADFDVTVVTINGSVVAVEPGDTTEHCYGMAFDLGTTTVVGTIIDVTEGREIAQASRLNAQVVYGEDTISRIKHVIDNPGTGGTDMAGKIREVINEIILEASDTAGIRPHQIYEAVFAGNTTMSHLFLGLDPAGLSQIPFVPVTNAGITLRATDAGIGIHPRGAVRTLPNIAGFVGSDTVGVMLACNYLDPGKSSLVVDVGTNGELALRRNGSLTVCSTAAGPALEGATLSCGMRAASGAVEHFTIGDDGDLSMEVIGDIEPIGVCGSGIIDIIAVLLEAGVLDPTGAINSAEEVTGSASPLLLKRIIEIDDQPAVLLHGPADNGKGERRVALTQRDVRQIQLAKGAIRAGINLLLSEAGMTADDLDEILLAGAFGNYIRKQSAVRIGLLPDIMPDRIRFVGNAAATGAKMVLLSKAVRQDADRIRHECRHIELAALPAFQNEFMNTLMFP